MLVSIVIPCYNSEQTIEKVVDLCMDSFAEWKGYDCEMILVNDFSRDQTSSAIRRAAEKYPDKVTAVNLAKNFGQHSALLAGFQYVSGDLAVGMDDDLQNRPEQIRILLDQLDENTDVVFGEYRKRNFNWFKNLTGRLTQYLLFRLIDRPRDVPMSSFWCARSFVIDEIKGYQGSDAFVQLLFARTTHHLKAVEVEHYAREAGSSNYTFRKSLKLFLSFLNYSTIPLRLSQYFGSLLSVIGFLSALILIIRKILDPSTILTGWSSLICLMLILFGILFLMIGILGDYIGKIVLTANGTPLYVIRDDVGKSASHCPAPKSPEGGSQDEGR